MRKNSKRISFFFSLLYVLLGTLVVLVSIPRYELLGFDHNHPLWLPALIITLPANLPLFMLAWVGLSWLSILILQNVVFLAIWWVCYAALSSVWPVTTQKKGSRSRL
ncbi:hypothetical protein [uncultured Chitinophaga sp.]|uniref:hypothetical protein n=1 Tax=uncultured Chitinophaga sp. TaxID=339340 RepID=UPI0025F0338D|nr:hypothetical protein [uncultured Chitinophaga sp.]